MNRFFTRENLQKAEIPIIFLISLCFILSISISTSIINPCLYCFDSAIFQSAGRLWTAGAVPYRDFFDHKGPLIFLIDAMAYSTPYPRLALCLIQAVSLSLVLSLNHRLLLKYTNPRTVLATLLIFLCYLSFIFNSGNLTEEYSLPFISLAEFFELPWLIEASQKDNNPMRHPPLYALLDGFCIGAISMLIIKNALLIVCLVLFVGYFMIRAKDFKGIALNILMGFLGLSAAILPFIIYFHSENSLLGFIEGTFIYNFSYLSGGSSYSPPSLSSLIKSSIFLLPIAMLFISAVQCLKKKPVLSVFAFFTAASSALLYMRGFSFKHYFIPSALLIPLSVILLCKGESRDFFALLKRPWKRASFPYLASCLVSVLIAATAALYLPKTLSVFSSENIERARSLSQALNEIIRTVPEDEKNGIAAYNLQGAELAFYIVNDIVPPQNHPYLTEFHAEYDPRIIQDYLDFLIQESPKWLVMSQSSENQELLEYVNSHYELKASVRADSEISMMLNSDALLLYEGSTE